MLLGWLKTNNKRCFSVLLLTSFSVLATQDSDQMPDMALLEYLAELVEVDGELIGPMDMADTNIGEAPNNTNEKPNKENSQIQDSKENDSKHSPDSDKAAKSLSKDNNPTTQEQ